jgi:hypothetical protein
MKSQIKKQSGGNCGVGSCPLQLGGHKHSLKNQSGKGCGCSGYSSPNIKLVGGKSRKPRKVKKTKSKKSKKSRK